MVRFGSIWVSNLLSDEPISEVRSGTVTDRSVQISDLKSILLDLCQSVSIDDQLSRCVSLNLGLFRKKLLINLFNYA